MDGRDSVWAKCFIAYADALAEAYDNGTCPEEIKDEAEILYFVNNYDRDDMSGQWAFL